MTDHLSTAQARIADCIARDKHGSLLRAADENFLLRRDYLNLAGLGLADGDLNAPFMFQGPDGWEPVAFQQLVGLRYLDLTGNQLTALPTGVESFAGLVWLGLNGNRLATVAGVEHLRRLERLYLRGNVLTALPEAMGNLAVLKELDLVQCPVTQLPSSLGHCAELEHLALDDEPLAADLRSVWKKGEWQRLREHLLRTDRQQLGVFRDSAEYRNTLANLGRTGGRYAEIVAAAGSMHELRMRLLEAHSELFPVEIKTEARLPVYHLGKLVLIGEQAHGKSRLQEALRGLPFQEGASSTHGMNRTRLSLNLGGELVREAPALPQEDVIDLQIWDMGGQRDFQFTNQMFFTPDAIYLAVLRSSLRKDASVSTMQEWLERVHRRTAGKATVILVITECPDAMPDCSALTRSFSDEVRQIIHAVVCVDSDGRIFNADGQVTGHADGPGIQHLRQMIAKVATLPDQPFRREYQQGWVPVIAALANRKEPYVRWRVIDDLIQEHGVEGEDAARDLVMTAHRIDTLLWRSDQADGYSPGQDVVILDPNWLSRAVVRLLLDQETWDRQGWINAAGRARVWRGPDTEGYPGYEAAEHDAVMELMEINELAYRPRDRGRVGQGEWLLLAQMVSPHRPPDLDAQWSRRTEGKPFAAHRVVSFEPIDGVGRQNVPEIVYLMIVRLKEFSLGREDYRQAVHWQHGLLIETSAQDHNRSAALIEWKDKELHLHVQYTLSDSLLDEVLRRISADHLKEAYQLRKVVCVACGSYCRKSTPGRGRFSMRQCESSEGDKVYCQQCDDRHALKDVLPCTPGQPLEEVKVILDRIGTAEQKMMREVRRGTRKTTRTIRASTKRIIDVSATSRDAILSALQEAKLNIIDAQNTVADNIILAMADDGLKGPRLFSLKPLEPKHWLKTRLTSLEMEVTVWCEGCLQPLPFVTNKIGSGQFTLAMEREWVRKASLILRFGILAGVAISSGGALGLGGAGDVAQTFAAGWEPMKELQQYLDADHGVPSPAKEPERAEWVQWFTSSGRLGFGVPLQHDLALTAYLRKQFWQRFGSWEGLEYVSNPRPGKPYIWAHPDGKARFS